MIFVGSKIADLVEDSGISRNYPPGLLKSGKIEFKFLEEPKDKVNVN